MKRIIEQIEKGLYDSDLADMINSVDEVIAGAAKARMDALKEFRARLDRKWEMTLDCKTVDQMTYDAISELEKIIPIYLDEAVKHGWELASDQRIFWIVFQKKVVHRCYIRKEFNGQPWLVYLDFSLSFNRLRGLEHMAVSATPFKDGNALTNCCDLPGELKSAKEFIRTLDEFYTRIFCGYK